MDWKQEMLKRLDALAEKLGTTAAYLWTVLMKQALSEGITDLIWGVAFAMVAVLSYKLALRARAYAETKDDDYYPGAVALYLACVVVIGVSLVYTTDAIQHFVNPAYYALHEVMQTLGK